ncbi:MAG: tetratricopeptide repeat protein, partial [Planctomycetota bacterium]
ADYTKALEINPGLAVAYINRGIAHYKKGQYDQARQDVHQAQTLGYEVQPALLKALNTN